jgi:hypothetical protein
MLDQRISHARLMPMYASIVGVPALLLPVILPIGETLAGTAPGPSLGTREDT